MDMKKILILGGDGMAGNMIRTYLEEMQYDVYVTTRKVTEGKNFFFDVLSDFRALEEILDTIRPDFVINSIGVLNQFAEENKSGAVLINSFLPHYVDSLIAEYHFKFIHISTDCVFSGDRGDYTEDDFADAISFYGRTKSLGEVKNERSVTFRTSIVGPDINEKGIGLFNWFMKQKGETKGYSKVLWAGVTTLELAKAIEKSFHSDITGLYHLVNNEKISKYDLLNLFKKSMQKNIEIIEEGASVNDKSIISTRTDFSFDIPSYEKMIDEMAQWIFDHPEKYNSIVVNAKQ